MTLEQIWNELRGRIKKMNEVPTWSADEGYLGERFIVVGVKEGINLPRYPTMKGRLASKKAEVLTIAPEGDEGGLHKVALRRPVEKRSETTILGTGPEAAPAVVDVLVEIGVL